MDIEAYFRRVEGRLESGASVDALRDLVIRHGRAIPFENLDPFLGRPVRLDLPSIEAKLVHGGRGGYCYEHNLLFRHVLEWAGVPVTSLGARVLWGREPGAVTPRTHMLLLVELDHEPWLVDVGFGTLSPILVRLVADVEQAVEHERFRLREAAGDYVLQAHRRGEWRDAYRFDLRGQHLVDYELANWYVSTHPSSHFVTSLMAVRRAPGRQYALRNGRLAIHHADGPSEERMLSTADDLRGALTHLLGMRLPESAELDAALMRATAAS